METKSVLKNNENQLVRRLGLFDSIMMIVGIVIGSGIFLITGIMATYLPSPGLILIAWATGRLISLAGIVLTFLGIPA